MIRLIRNYLRRLSVFVLQPVERHLQLAGTSFIIDQVVSFVPTLGTVAACPEIDKNRIIWYLREKNLIRSGQKSKTTSKKKQ